jgi:putative SOS response-associated peptidase YedK
MCGRFTLRTPQNLLVEKFGREAKPRYNIAPTQQVFVLRGGQREVVEMRWGFTLSATGQLMINARAETAASKPAFRDALRQRRCLVPADGFYEWKREGGRKQPYLIQMLDGGLFTFAGLWQGEPGQESFTILTTEANELLSPLHNRMPVIIETADQDRWLDPRTAVDDVQALLRTYPSDKMKIHPVSSRVNSAAHDDPRCAEPRPPEQLLF